MGEYFAIVPFLFVLGVVFLNNKRKLEERRIASGQPLRSEPDPQQARQIADLQERVKVLERIVTDGGYDLASKIEALRDQRPLQAQQREREGQVDG